MVFEGPGFAGKSTIMREVKEELEKEGFEVVMTREPGGCPEAEKIRSKIFLEKKLGNLTPRQETYLFYMAREINMNQVVLPNIERGVIVLKDRDYMSTFKYQELSGMSRDELVKIHNDLYVDYGFSEPDLRLVLSINEESLRERASRGAEGDPFDDMALDMVKAYGAEALDITRGRGMFAKNTVVVDANYAFEVVKNNCLRLIKERSGLNEDMEGKRRGVEY